MTAADLIKAAKQFEDENGIDELLLLLNDIMLCRSQAYGMEIETEDDGDDEFMPVYTVQ